MSSINDLPSPPRGIDDLPPPPEPSAMSRFARSTVDALPALGGMAGGVLGTPADIIAGPAGNMAGAAVGGYLGSAAKNLINTYYNPDAAPKTANQMVTAPLKDAAEQASMQGVAEFTAPYVSKAVEAAGNAASSGAKWVGTKLLSALGGVRPEVIKEYAEFADRINAAPSVDQLKEISDDFVGKLSSNVDAKKMTLDQAQDAYKAFQSDVKDAYRSASYDARDAVTSAQQTLKDAYNSKIKDVSQDLYDTVGQLKADVSKGSAESYKILDKSGEAIPVEPIKQQVSGLINDLKVAGKSAVGEDATSAINQLQRLKGTLDQFPEDLPAQEAKKMLQQLQRSTSYAKGSGTFSESADRAFQTVNATINAGLKSQVPEYAEKMEQVAADTDLLKRVSDFGDKQTAAGILGRLHAPNQLERKAALIELGQKYNSDFVGAVNPKNLPEQGLIDQAAARLDSLRPDRVAENVAQTVSNSRQQGILDAAQSGLNEAQKRLAPFRSLAPNSAGQTQAQQKLIQLGQGKNIELEGMFKELGKMTDTDFVQAMKDRNTLAAFQKGATNGSRNTLMGALAGFLFGGIPGATTGGVAGRVVDQWGPALTKKALDGAIAVSKSPSIQTIQNLNLPDPIKRGMLVGFEDYLAQARQPLIRQSSSTLPAVRRPASDGQSVGEDLWAQQGIQKLGIEDKNLAQKLIQDPQGRHLLIQASDLAPGSRAMKNVMKQIQKGFGGQ